MQINQSPKTTPTRKVTIRGTSVRVPRESLTIYAGGRAGSQDAEITITPGEALKLIEICAYWLGSWAACEGEA